MQTIGGRIRDKRIAYKLTMQELADALGKSKGNISEYEKGKYEPSAQTVIALSKIFKVSTDWLLTGEDFLNRTYGLGPQIQLSKQESDLVSMFRLLDERGREDAYDYIYFKYRRAFQTEVPIYPAYRSDRVAEEASTGFGKKSNKKP